jgi:conjugative relaxase-like TrwC/TraI family protein
MSAVLGFAKGYSVSYLTGPVASGREGYYSGAVAAGEPPGQWWGAGAQELGLAGEVDSDLMEAIYARLLDPRDEATHERARWAEAPTLGAPHKKYATPQELYEKALLREPDAGPERRAELLAAAEKKARQPIAFFDMTFSPSKSVTVLSVAFERAANDARSAGRLAEADAWRAMNEAVEKAVMAGARASIDYLEEVAGYARVGRHGGGANRWGDANKFVVAQFLQHDSRDRDPQLHVHQAILNKLQRVDGNWTGVDESALRLHRWSAGAIGERVMEAELARILGVRFETRPDGAAREIVGVDQAVMDLFSSRRHAVTARAAELIADFEQRHGREASVLERKLIHEQATLLTRKGKSHDGETAEERLDRWERQARTALTGGLSKVAHDVLAQRDAGPAESWDERDVLERALAMVGKNQQTWTRSDLIFAVSSALPGNLGVEPTKVRTLLEGLADKALADAVVVVATEDADGLPADFRLANGLSAYQRPGSAKFTTPDQLTAERINERAAVRTGAAKLTAEQAAAAVDRFAAAGFRLGVDQDVAVRGVLTSGAHVETLTAAAGTGKSFTVGAIAEAWAEHGHRTFGLAASQNAADIMSEEGVRAFNISRWRGELERDEDLQLRPGDLVVVDEAGMASTQDVADIVQRCEAAAAKLLLVGDSRQLAAVGPGGALADLGAQAKSYELTEVRRFSHAWEGDASLRLREGDVSALDDYDKHGRLRSAGTPEEAERKASRAWLADTLAGRRSLLLVGSNEAAARVNADLRAELVRLGRVEERGVALDREGTVAGVGDVVQARKNNWRIDTPVINRQTFRVTEILEDGSLRVESRDGNPMVLPAEYVREDVTLAYASTVHAAQGRTVDTAHGVVDKVDANSAYVMATRGADSNTLWVVTKPLASDAPVGEAQEVEPRTAKAVLGDMLERAEEERGALAQQAQAVEDEKSTFRNFDRLIDAVSIMSGGRTSNILDHLAADGVISAEERERFAADEAMGSVERLLRHAEVSGRDPAQLVRDALDGKSLADARSVGQVLHARLRNEVGKIAPRISSYRDLIPSWTPERWRPYLEDLAERSDQRRHELGARVAEEPPQWARETLGPVPEDPLRRAVWESRAGWAAADRENSGYTDEANALGPAPAAGLPEKHAVWCTAHDALGLPDVSAEEAMLTDGQLRMRVAAWEREQQWAPRYVADELAATNEEAATARANAQLWAAHAETLNDAERKQVAQAAREADERAEELELQALALAEADQARARWYAHTAVTRDLAERGKVELGRRGVDLTDTSGRVTAAEWLEAHRAELAEAEQHRAVYETDLAADERVDDRPRGVETAVADIRDVAVIDPNEAVDATPRRQVPDADATAAAVARAREALLEVHARETADRVREDEEAAERAQQWLAAREEADVAARSA